MEEHRAETPINEKKKGSKKREERGLKALGTLGSISTIGATTNALNETIKTI